MVTNNKSKSSKVKSGPAPVKVKFSHRLLLNAKSQLQRQSSKEKPEDETTATSSLSEKKNKIPPTSISESKGVAKGTSPKPKARRPPKKPNTKGTQYQHQRRAASSTLKAAPTVTMQTSRSLTSQRQAIAEEEDTRGCLYAEGSIANIVLNRMSEKQRGGSSSAVVNKNVVSSSLSSSHASSRKEEIKDVARKRNNAERSHQLEISAQALLSSNPTGGPTRDESRAFHQMKPNKKVDSGSGIANEGEVKDSKNSGGKNLAAENILSDTTKMLATTTGIIVAASPRAQEEATTADDKKIPAAASGMQKGRSKSAAKQRQASSARLLVRSTVRPQPRPSPPFASLAKVVKGPYAGMSGYLSPTGTYGYSIISNSTGWFATVNDNHVVEDDDKNCTGAGITGPPAQENKQEKGKKSGAKDITGDEPIETIFLECLYSCIQDDQIRGQRQEVEQLRTSTCIGGDNENEEMQRLREDLVRLQEEKLNKLYAAHPLIKIATNAFQKEMPPPKAKSSAGAGRRPKRQLPTSKTVEPEKRKKKKHYQASAAK
ncbi:hypothetical protein ACA910_021860 [Epithemia clementina (nom. ined.)]